mgnify:CR=1 FL=1
MNQEKIGKLIKKIRIKNKLSQKEFADKYGVTPQAVSKWETGKNIPDIAILKEIIQDENIEKEKIRQIMKKIVPTYHEPEEVNTSIKNSRKELGEKAKSKQTKAEVATA